MVKNVGIRVKRKRMLIIIFSVLLMLALLFVKGRLELNLKKYAPYYAQNVEGRFSPEWEALRFMLYRDSRQIPGYHFKQDTLTSNIRFRVNSRGSDITFAIYGDEGTEINLTYHNVMYALSAEGRIEYIFSKRCDCRVSPSEEDQTLINEIIEEIGAPLVGAQPTPDWNLQWLYNLLNQRG